MELCQLLLLRFLKDYIKGVIKVALVQKIKQFRYYAESAAQNFPSTLTAEQLVSGSCFNSYLPAVEIGVAALPGTKFYINGLDNPIIVNFSGLFNLRFKEVGLVDSISFDPNTIEYIKTNDSAYLIVDLIYYKDEENLIGGQGGGD